MKNKYFFCLLLALVMLSDISALVAGQASEQATTPQATPVSPAAPVIGQQGIVLGQPDVQRPAASVPAMPPRKLCRLQRPLLKVRRGHLLTGKNSRMSNPCFKKVCGR